jgi:glyoxylate/hydroxypyruvate reductase
MSLVTASESLFHFETMANRPRVFRITPALIADAKSRSHMTAETSLGEDLDDLSWISRAAGLITHNDILVSPKFPLQTLAQAAPCLRWIHVTGAGIEPLLPLDWLPSHVVLTNNSGVHAEKTGESASMMLLMLNARVPAIVTNQRASRWKQIFSSSIHGRTVLIIGVGDMGGAVAKAARKLGLQTLGIRRSGAPHPYIDQMYRPESLDSLLPLADFVVMAAPLTTETTELLDRRRLGLMKQGSGFINVGRAGSVDNIALAGALNAGALSGAVLDVFEAEPLPAQSPLWTTDNLVMMPHVTSDDEDEYLPKTLDLVFDNIGRLATGMPLINVVDRQREY